MEVVSAWLLRNMQSIVREDAWISLEMLVRAQNFQFGFHIARDSNTLFKLVEFEEHFYLRTPLVEHSTRVECSLFLQQQPLSKQHPKLTYFAYGLLLNILQNLIEQDFQLLPALLSLIHI